MPQTVILSFVSFVHMGIENVWQLCQKEMQRQMLNKKKKKKHKNCACCFATPNDGQFLMRTKEKCVKVNTCFAFATHLSRAQALMMCVYRLVRFATNQAAQRLRYKPEKNKTQQPAKNEEREKRARPAKNTKYKRKNH